MTNKGRGVPEGPSEEWRRRKGRLASLSTPLDPQKDKQLLAAEDILRGVNKAMNKVTSGPGSELREGSELSGAARAARAAKSILEGGV